jgi:preprotein translocase subunit YajC
LHDFNQAGMSAFFLVWLQAGGSMGLVAVGAQVLLFIGVLYLLLIMPQQRRQKKWQEMVGQIKAGDRVVTSGGLRGVVFAIKDDAITLRVPPDNLKLEVSKSSIVSLTTDDK